MLNNGYITLTTLTANGVSSTGDPVPAIVTETAKIACNIKYLQVAFQVVEGGRMRSASAAVTLDFARIPTGTVLSNVSHAKLYNALKELETEREIVMIRRLPMMHQLLILLA